MERKQRQRSLSKGMAEATRFVEKNWKKKGKNMKGRGRKEYGSKKGLII
jgi:hypothetical protein